MTFVTRTQEKNKSELSEIAIALTACVGTSYFIIFTLCALLCFIVIVIFVIFVSFFLFFFFLIS